IANGDAFAVSSLLASAARRRSKPRAHHRKCLARSKHVIVSRPRVIGVAMGYDRALGSAIRIDMKAPRPAEETLPVDREPAIKLLGYHGSNSYRTSPVPMGAFGKMRRTMANIMGARSEDCQGFKRK